MREWGIYSKGPISTFGKSSIPVTILLPPSPAKMRGSDRVCEVVCVFVKMQSLSNACLVMKCVCLYVYERWVVNADVFCVCV